LRAGALLLLAAVLCCVGLSGCAGPALSSAWRNRELSIDGKYADWGNYTSYYDESAKVVLNLANDAEHIYICLITRNRSIEARIMESGLTCWFDPAGAKDRAFGIRFPVGLARMGISLEEKDRDITRDWQDQTDKSGLIDREKDRYLSKEFNQRLETLEALQDKFEIMSGELKKPDAKGRPKERPPELTLAEGKKLGVEARVGRENDYFVYELRVPLRRSELYPYAIGIRPDQPVIGIGLEIAPDMPEFDGPAGQEEDRGMPAQADRKLRRSGEFKLWATVTLASEDR